MILYREIAAVIGEAPGRAVIEYFGKPLSGAAFLRRVDALSAALQGLGLEPGDRVGICLPNLPDAVALFYGANRAGLTPVMLSPKSAPAELSLQLRMTGCRVLFFADLFYRPLRPLLEEGFLRQAIPIPVSKGLSPGLRFAVAGRCASAHLPGKKPAALLPLNAFLAKGTGRIPRDEACPEGLGAILFTSGSEGDPKGVLLSERAINCSAKSCIATVEDIRPGSGMLAVLPIFHAFGLNVAIHIAFLARVRCILVPFFRPKSIARIIIRQKPAFFPAVPTIFSRILSCGLLQKAEAKGKLDFSQFRLGFCGGDDADPALLDQWNGMIARCGGTGRISAGYGMTECCPVCLSPQGVNLRGCVGAPFGDLLPGIFDPETGQPLPAGRVGELYLSGSALLEGYLKADGTWEDPFLFPDGLRRFPTGDLFEMDDAGLLHFRGRKKRLVKISGHTVMEPAVERACLESGLLSEAHVVALPHPTRGCCTAVLAVPREGCDPTPEQIREAVARQMIPYAVPAVVRFCSADQVPRTPLGKPDRARIIEAVDGEPRREE